MSSLRFADRHDQAPLSGPEYAYAGRLCADIGMAVLGQALVPVYRSNDDEPRGSYPPGGGFEPPPIMRFIPSDAYVWREWQSFLDSVYVASWTPPLAKDRTPLYYRTTPPDATFRFEKCIETYAYGVSGQHLLIPVEGTDEPQEMGFTEIWLNTALTVGDDALRLLARISGQSSRFLFVDGPNRAWLAGIIERGLADHVLRGPGHPKEDRTWAGVAEFLRQRDDEPVVTDYSGDDSFPCLGFVAGHVPEAERYLSDDRDGDSWYDLPTDERWDMGLAALRAREVALAAEDFLSPWTYELRPDESFGGLRYLYGTTAFDLAALIWDAHAEVAA